MPKNCSNRWIKSLKSSVSKEKALFFLQNRQIHTSNKRYINKIAYFCKLDIGNGSKMNNNGRN